MAPHRKKARRRRKNGALKLIVGVGPLSKLNKFQTHGIVHVTDVFNQREREELNAISDQLFLAGGLKNNKRSRALMKRMDKRLSVEWHTTV